MCIVNGTAVTITKEANLRVYMQEIYLIAEYVTNIVRLLESTKTFQVKQTLDNIFGKAYMAQLKYLLLQLTEIDGVSPGDNRPSTD